MGKTIRKIANELQITKQAVSQRMDAIDNFRENHTKMIGNKIIVDEYGEQLIVNFELGKNNRQDYQQEHHQERKEHELGALIHQLSVKDNQIQELQGELSKQQQLELEVLSENKELRERINKLEKNADLTSKNYHKKWHLW